MNRPVTLLGAFSGAVAMCIALSCATGEELTAATGDVGLGPAGAGGSDTAGNGGAAGNGAAVGASGGIAGTAGSGGIQGGTGGIAGAGGLGGTGGDTAAGAGGTGGIAGAGGLGGTGGDTAAAAGGTGGDTAAAAGGIGGTGGLAGTGGTGGVVCTAETDPAFCTRLGKNCGSVTAPDNCATSRTVASCGSCTQPQTCGGSAAGTANVCGCAVETDPAFCTRLGKNCGSVTAPDNCGTSRTVASCGTCTPPQICAGAGTANMCEDCTAETDAALCTRLGKNCGSVSGTDNCGASRTASCGTCTAPLACAASNVCQAAGCNLTPYGGTARALPGTVQAEDFDTDPSGTPPGEGCAYHDLSASNDGNDYRTSEGVDIDVCGDTGGGYRIIYMRTGEWLAYTVSVTTAGTYSLNFRVGSNGGVAGAFHLEDETATNLTGSLSVPDTGSGNTFQTVTKTGVALGAGVHVLKLVVDSGPATNAQWTLNYFSAQ
jgi:Carbohydrate binding module (family 6)